MILDDEAPDDPQVSHTETTPSKGDYKEPTLDENDPNSIPRNLILNWIPRDREKAEKVLRNTVDAFFLCNSISIEDIKDMLCDSVMESKEWHLLKTIGAIIPEDQEDHTNE